MFNKRPGAEHDLYIWSDMPITVWECNEGPHQDIQIVFHNKSLNDPDTPAISMLLGSYGMNFVNEFLPFQAENIINHTIKKISSIIGSNSFKDSDPYKVIYNGLDNWDGWSGI